ncbi:translation initiation factor 2 [Streptomyces sp. NPDC058326]|uniref:translation initiation factor 2 n=1 Tax=Streptomyces sp. NPDC058326 TaxID=3346447 RepID=UPI0036E3E869
MLVVVRSAGALHRLLDVLPVFRGDSRVVTRFTLAPGSDFDIDALAALDRSGARTMPWRDALRARHDLILAASPKGDLRRLSGPRVLLPHGAGFNKAVHGDGSPGTPSGLDPHYLLADGHPWADVHALAHEEQVTRLASYSPLAASRGVVVGDPTLDRLLASVPHRDGYRATLGTGPRRLIAVTSTWGPESLLARRPGLVAELLGLLPHDTSQVALILHPNEYSAIGTFDLSGRLAPALDAGLVLAAPYEEWAAVLVAADAVVTDHGSTALYAAALGTPVVNAYDSGDELLPGSPLARLLGSVPRLTSADALEAALRTARSIDTRVHAADAFAHQGQALPRLRTHLYRLLGLKAEQADLDSPAFPQPTPPSRRPLAFAVRAEVTGDLIQVERFPASTPRPTHHLAAEYPGAGPRQLQSAAVLWRRPAYGASSSTSRRATWASDGWDTQGWAAEQWTAEGWTAHALHEYPGCRTAAAILTQGRILIRHRSAGLLTARLELRRDGGRVSYPDPSAVVSAVHVWLGSGTPPASGATLMCDTGAVAVRVHVEDPRTEELLYEL